MNWLSLNIESLCLRLRLLLVFPGTQVRFCQQRTGRIWKMNCNAGPTKHISPKENETTAPYLSWVSGVLNLPKELPCIVFYSHSTYETKPVIHKRLNAPWSVAVPPLKVVGAPHVKQMEQTPRSTSFVAFRIITPFRTCRGSSSNMLMFMPNKRYIFHLQGQICSWATVIAWSCVESEEMCTRNHTYTEYAVLIYVY